MFLGMFAVILLLPLGLPGGNQVDGLPPAASNDREVVATTTKGNTDPPAASWPGGVAQNFS